MKRKAPDSRETACLLCRRADVSVDVCGPKHQQQDVCVHECCLYSATGLGQRGTTERGICGFLPADIKQKAKSAARKRCFACGERGACISCQAKGCNRSFHLPCASEHGCVTQFFRRFKSFCWEHRPEQAVQARPEPDTICIICQEPVEDKISHTTMVCPACKGAWFHRACIRGQAVSAGRWCFRCPHCNNKKKFVPEMLRMGIFIPPRTPTWEEEGAYEELNERHSRCDASWCLSRQGRQQAEESGPWELLLCSSCAAKGTHRRCSALGTATDSWECDECAGLGSAPSIQSGLVGTSNSTSTTAGTATAGNSTATSASTTMDTTAGTSTTAGISTTTTTTASTSTTAGTSISAGTSTTASTTTGTNITASATSISTTSTTSRSQQGLRSSSSSLEGSSTESDSTGTSSSSQPESTSSSDSDSAPESSILSGRAGPDRRPGRSRVFRRSGHPYTRP